MKPHAVIQVQTRIGQSDNKQAADHMRSSRKHEASNFKAAAPIEPLPQQPTHEAGTSSPPKPYDAVHSNDARQSLTGGQSSRPLRDTNNKDGLRYSARIDALLHPQKAVGKQSIWADGSAMPAPPTGKSQGDMLCSSGVDSSTDRRSRKQNPSKLPMETYTPPPYPSPSPPPPPRPQRKKWKSGPRKRAGGAGTMLLLTLRSRLDRPSRPRCVQPSNAQPFHPLRRLSHLCCLMYF